MLVRSHSAKARAWFTTSLPMAPLAGSLGQSPALSHEPAGQGIRGVACSGELPDSGTRGGGGSRKSLQEAYEVVNEGGDAEPSLLRTVTRCYADPTDNGSPAPKPTQQTLAGTQETSVRSSHRRSVDHRSVGLGLPCPTSVRQIPQGALVA